MAGTCPECGTGVDVEATDRLLAEGKPGIIMAVGGNHHGCKTCHSGQWKGVEQAGRDAAKRREEAALKAILGDATK